MLGMPRLLKNKAFRRAVGMAGLILATVIVVTLMGEYVINIVLPVVDAVLGKVPVAGVATATGGNTTGAAVAAIGKPIIWQSVYRDLGAALVFFVLGIVLIMWIAWLRKRWFGSSAALIRKTDNIARKAVIMGISEDSVIRKNIMEARKAGVSPAELDMQEFLSDELKNLQDNLGFSKASLSIGEMTKAKLLVEGEFKGRPQWQAKEGNGADHKWVQNIRALRPHVEARKLEYVILIPSAESHIEAGVFKSLLEKMLANASEGQIKVSVLEGSKPAYNDFEEVRDAFLNALAWTRKQPTIAGGKITLRDICIDATAGMATFSIGAALVTLNHDLVYSYVTTLEQFPSEKGGEGIFFDATVDLAAFIKEV